METLKYVHRKYTENSGNYQLVMPINFNVLIPEDDSVRLLSQIMEELDYKNLMLAYSSKGRNPVVTPRILFQVLVYAYMNGIYTTRRIEESCRRDINFLWLLQGQIAPDHNTIARFRTGRLAGCIENLFSQLISKLSELGEITYENVFIDGTKIEANAGKYTFVWKKTVSSNADRMKEKIRSFSKEAGRELGTIFPFSEDTDTGDFLQSLLEKLYTMKKSMNLEFVSGTGRRKTTLQRLIESAEDFLSRLKQYESYGKIFKGRNSFSKTDHDATFMHMKDDHMRNAQLKPGYNMQIGVEGGYVVGVDVSSERSDQLTLIPFLKKLEKTLPQKFSNVIADAGYESEENYLYLEENGQKAYIKPQIYEQWKKRSFKNLIGKRENMTYDEILDEYICSQGRKLKAKGNSKRRSKSGYEAEVTRYECESCDECTLKSKCTKAQGHRQLETSKVFLKKRAASWENIMAPHGIMLRMNRSIQVEGAFGVMKEDYGFRRFLTRGKQNVHIEFLLLCFGFNINKLHQKVQSDNCRKLLYFKEAA
jgi:transposase